MFEYQGRRQDFGSKGEYQTKFPLASPEFRFVGGHSAKIYSTKTFKNFWKIYIKFSLKFKYSFKFFKNKVLKIFVKMLNILNK